RVDTPRKHKESLCLLWFTHNILFSKDPGNNIIIMYFNFCQDIEAFKNYPWGHESFHLTFDYILRPFEKKNSTLFGFPWAFMLKLKSILHAYVATFVSHVSTYDSSVATCDTDLAIDESCVATCAINIAIDDSSIATCAKNVATDESCVATCDTYWYS
ncbi:hypothetical protein EJD97_023225, partial [Solanum chilense]